MKKDSLFSRSRLLRKPDTRTHAHMHTHTHTKDAVLIASATWRCFYVPNKVILCFCDMGIKKSKFRHDRKRDFFFFLKFFSTYCVASQYQWAYNAEAEGTSAQNQFPKTDRGICGVLHLLESAQCEPCAAISKVGTFRLASSVPHQLPRGTIVDTCPQRRCLCEQRTHCHIGEESFFALE